MLIKNYVRKLVKDSYLVGLTNGYGLGYISGQAENQNKGVILGAKVEEQVDKIMEEAEF